MYSLIIAEDEALVREVLVNADYWKLCGITRIFEARNGAEACRLMQSESVDFILTDIRMPVMDGLELLFHVKETNPDIECVMLTGFDDFEYVRTAMRLGASDYLLKPVKDEELMQLFLKLAGRRQEKRLEQYRRALELSEWKQSRQLLREQFLADWFSGRKTDPEWIERKRNELDIVWNADDYVVMLLEADRSCGLAERYSRRDLELLHYGIRNIAEEVLSEGFGQFYIFPDDERLVIWREAADEAEMEERLKRIRRSVKQYLKITVTIGISKRHTAVSDVYQAYLEAMNSLKMKWYLGSDRTFFFDRLPQEEGRPFFHREFQDRLHHAVAMGDEEQLQSHVAGLFAEVRSKKISALQIEHMMLAVMQIVQEHMEPAEFDAQFGNSPEKWLDRARSLDTIDEIETFVASCFRQAMEASRQRRKHKKSKLISDVLQYLDEHYKEDISLQQLADRFFVNASYLSRLFKEEVGHIFTKHVMRLRVEKAQHLLKTTHLKIYEVSEAVGYSDVKYFNKIFKDFTGLTPAEYRNL